MIQWRRPCILRDSVLYSPTADPYGGCDRDKLKQALNLKRSRGLDHGTHPLERSKVRDQAEEDRGTHRCSPPPAIRVSYCIGVHAALWASGD